MRSVAEIDADIARLQEAKAGMDWGLPTRLMPEYRAGRFDYIVEGDRSGLDAYQQAVNDAYKQKVQRKFQDEQRLAAEAFQREENEKNRAVQQKQAAHEKIMDKAKLIKAARDSQAIVDDAKNNKGKYTAVEEAKAKNQLALDVQLMADSGLFTADELSKFDVSKPEGPANNPPEDNNPRIAISDLKSSVKNAKTLDDVKAAKETLAGLDKNEYNADDWNAIETDLNKKETEIKKADDAKAQKKSRIDEGKKHSFTKSEVRKLLDVRAEGGGKKEAEANYSYTHNGKTYEAKGKWIRSNDGKQAKLVVDGETLQIVDLY